MMKPMAGISRALSSSIAAATLAMLLSGCGGASPVAPLPQNVANNSPTEFPPGTIMLSKADVSTPATYSDLHYHIAPVGKPGLVHPMSVVFPLDMANGGGAVLKATTQNDIFVNTTSSAVGTPTTFQGNLNLSTFITVLNQYDGVTSTGKFPVGTSFAAAVTAYSNVISQNQLFNIIHAAAKTGGTGYGHEYDVFLANGLDTCIDFGPCYSPDNPPTWVFCAYHASVTFTDIGHVVFMIIPYQNVSGCGDVGISGLPNPAPIDSTATAISHEFSESVSDADPNSAWFNATFGMEIGDVCNSDRALETLNGHKYVIQPEYSNSAHGCFF